MKKGNTRGWETAGKTKGIRESFNTLSVADQEMHRRAFLYFLNSLSSGSEVDIETLQLGKWTGIACNSLLFLPLL